MTILFYGLFRPVNRVSSAIAAVFSLSGCSPVLVAFGGLGWLTFVSPALSNYLSPYNMAQGILGEAALTVWLLAVGVNARRWNEQASAAA